MTYYDNGGFRQRLPFSWTALTDKHCRHPIAIMGVVDMFGQRLQNVSPNQDYLLDAYLPGN
jgi:hypothetical protein